MHKFHGSGSHQDPKKAGFLGMGFLGTQWRHSFEINRGELHHQFASKCIFGQIVDMNISHLCGKKYKPFRVRKKHHRSF